MLPINDIKKLSFIDSSCIQGITHTVTSDFETVHSFKRIWDNIDSYDKHVVQEIKNTQQSWLRIFTDKKGHELTEYLNYLQKLKSDALSYEAKEISFADPINKRNDFRFAVWVDVEQDVIFSYHRVFMDNVKQLMQRTFEDPIGIVCQPDVAPEYIDFTCAVKHGIF